MYQIPTHPVESFDINTFSDTAFDQKYKYLSIGFLCQLALHCAFLKQWNSKGSVQIKHG